MQRQLFKTLNWDRQYGFGHGTVECHIAASGRAADELDRERLFAVPCGSLNQQRNKATPRV